MLTKKTPREGIMSLTLIVVIIGLLLSSCADETSLRDNAPSLNKVNTAEGYLTVDEHSIPALLKEVSTKSVAELDKWEDQRGFYSLRRLMEKAVAEETKYFDKLEAIGEENLVQQNTVPHAPFVLENAKHFRFTDDGWFELKVANYELAALLNTDGMIKVGKELRKYSGDILFVSESGDLSKLKGELDARNLPRDIKAYTIERHRKEHDLPDAKVVNGNLSVNSCTNVVNRYRVRLYEDILVKPRGSGTWELQHQFTVKSFRHTVWGWQRNFATNYLRGGVTYQADWGLGSDYIYANGAQHEIGTILLTGYLYSESFPPSIYYSRGDAWGRDDCHCTYEGYY